MASSSSTPRRCTTCREWGKPDPTGHCKHCGDVFAPADLQGLPRGA